MHTVSCNKQRTITKQWQAPPPPPPQKTMTNDKKMTITDWLIELRFVSHATQIGHFGEVLSSRLATITKNGTEQNNKSKEHKHPMTGHNLKNIKNAKTKHNTHKKRRKNVNPNRHVNFRTAHMCIDVIVTTVVHDYVLVIFCLNHQTNLVGV